MHDMIIALAKTAILVALNQPENFDLEHALQEYPMLKQNAAVFVTIHTKPYEELRGCIGTLKAHRPLYKDIIFNAQAAALHDTRFKPLTLNELPHIKVEVALLNEPQPLTYQSIKDLKAKIKTRTDGVILQYKGYQATYLPQVWEELPTFDAFFKSLCLKAKLTESCLTLHPNISTYQVTKFKEK